MIRSSLAVVAAATLTAAIVPPAAAQETAEQRLGTVHFETSCNETAQRRFDRAMRYQHSFWYSASKDIFEEALKADPSCAIAYWGIAQSLLLNPFGPPPPKNLTDGLIALEKGEAIPTTAREKDYILALKTFYAEHDKRE